MPKPFLLRQRGPRRYRTPNSHSDVPGAHDRRRQLSINRNAPCPCGSGRKYKHCHGLLQEAAGVAAPAAADGTDDLALLMTQGVDAAQSGRLAEALRLFERARTISPAAEEVNLNLGTAYFQLGRLEESLACLESALAANPQSLLALNLRGCALAQLGRPLEAVAEFDKALAIAGDDPLLLTNRGNALNLLGRYAEALGCIDSALAQNPFNPGALVGRSETLQGLCRYAEALASTDKALALDPNLPEALNIRGNALLELGRPDDALASYDRALALRPDYADALSNRGNVLSRLERNDEALTCIDHALAIAPDNATAHYNRGNALSDLGRYEDAIKSYQRALEIRPGYAEAAVNLGMAQWNLHRYDEALASYGRAIAIRPDFAEAHLNLSYALLATGNLQRGWDEYEWRWRAGEFMRMPGLPQPLWDGKRVDGTLLAWGEQGLGDQILHAGMLDDLRRLATRLLVQVEPRLVPLFTRSFSDIEILPQGKEISAERASAHVPLGSIGRYLRAQWADFPKNRTGYLQADPGRADMLRKRLAADGRRVVGISWISKVKRQGAHKSARLLDFEPLLKIPGVRFVDLQYGDTREELREVAAATGIQVERVEDIDNFRDIDGLTALIGACDAVVSVSNTTVHIAAGLGKPVYILLPYSQGTLWYWHVKRGDCPWYPSAKLFRQTRIGDWSGPISEVAAELKRG